MEMSRFSRFGANALMFQSASDILSALLDSKAVKLQYSRNRIRILQQIGAQISYPMHSYTLNMNDGRWKLRANRYRCNCR